MARFKISMQGNKALIQGLEKLSKLTKQMVGDEIEASTYEIHSEAVQRVPVDTGFLKNSINAQYQNMHGQVEATMNYAPYIEFGTGGMVNVPEGLETYAMQFKGKGDARVSMRPQPFLYPAFARETPKLLERINKGLEKLTN